MSGMLFSQMRPPAALEADFNDWYDTEHIPARLVLDGFRRADRYVEVDEPGNYLAVYQLDDMRVLQHPEYRALKEQPSERTATMLSSVSGFTRFICDLVADSGDAGQHRFLQALAFEIPEDEVDDFDDFYDTEHTPMLLEADGWLRIHRYRVRSGDGGSWTHFVLHELAERSVMDSPERQAARSAPKRTAMGQRPWFANADRWLYERRPA
ncbi:MAG: hypothetical protein JJT89_11885 [Nitriliruptoraceae bacterium]|nr:hypothetical protein [Nitriliruptoraceae bacterium]